MNMLASLIARYDRLAERGEIERIGMSREKISICVLLDAHGNVLDLADIRDMSDAKPLPKLLAVPTPPKRSSNVIANLFWDKTLYAFGAKLDKATGLPVAGTRGEWNCFRRSNLELLIDATDPGLLAFRRYLESWRGDQFCHTEQCAELAGAGLLDANAVFKLDGEGHYVHGCDEARDLLMAHAYRGDSADAPSLQCGLTGVESPAARLHPSIKGVFGSASPGALMTCNTPSGQNYGLTQGFNAPISQRAAAAYGLALNRLLARDSKHRIGIGAMTVAFWCDADDADADAAEDLIAMLAAPPTDADELAKVADKLRAVARGVPLADIDPYLDPDTHVCVLGLSQSQTVICTRYWATGSLGTIVARLGEHYRDLRLGPASKNEFPSVRSLLYALAPMTKKSDRGWRPRSTVGGDINQHLAADLMQSILDGREYPRTLYYEAVTRYVNEAGNPLNRRRLAIGKACLARSERLQAARNGKEWEDHLMNLNTESADAAYNLGRLFATYCRMEYEYADRNADLESRMLRAASRTPLQSYATLRHGYVSNYNAVLKRTRGRAVYIDQVRRDVASRLPIDIPARLSLAEQTRFLIGFDHQIAWFWTKKTDADAAANCGNDNNDLDADG